MADWIALLTRKNEMTSKTFILLAALFIGLMILAACAPAHDIQAPTPPTQILPTETGTAPAHRLSPTRTVALEIVSPQPALPQAAVISDPAMVIKNWNELLTAFNQKLKTTGWIRTVYTSEYFDNLKMEYWEPQVKEEWYRFDPDGQLIEAYNWISAQDGTIQQEAIFQGGAWYNVTLGGSSRSPNTKVDFTGGFADQIESGKEITQEAVRYHEVDAWRFYLEMDDGGLRMARALFIDRNSGLIRGRETYAVQSDGSLKLVSGAIYTHFEVDADPPLQRFQQILEKAQRMH
jgi:hypothetical protein